MSATRSLQTQLPKTRINRGYQPETGSNWSVRAGAQRMCRDCKNVPRLRTPPWHFPRI